MTLMLITTTWILGLALVAGLCMAASRGDCQPEAALCEAHLDRPRGSGEIGHRASAAPTARRAGAAEHGELAGAGRAAA